MLVLAGLNLVSRFSARSSARGVSAWREQDLDRDRELDREPLVESVWFVTEMFSSSSSSSVNRSPPWLRSSDDFTSSYVLIVRLPFFVLIDCREGYLIDWRISEVCSRVVVYGTFRAKKDTTETGPSLSLTFDGVRQRRAYGKLDSK